MSKSPALNAPGPSGSAQRSRRIVLPKIFAADERIAQRTSDFFAAGSRSPNTLKAYARAMSEFSAWCEAEGHRDVRRVRTEHISGFIKSLKLSPASVAQKVAALRTLFDSLTEAQLLSANPVVSIRVPRLARETTQTPVLSADEVRAILNGIDASTETGLRDRALLALMYFGFARVSEAIATRISDVHRRDGYTWIRLPKKKSGDWREMPCHRNLELYLHTYLERARVPGQDGWLFCTCAGRSLTLSNKPMKQADVHRMIRRRAEAVGIQSQVSCHGLRASGLTEFLRCGGRLETAQFMAGHESARTTAQYQTQMYQFSIGDVDRLKI